MTPRRSSGGRKRAPGSRSVPVRHSDPDATVNTGASPSAAPSATTRPHGLEPAASGPEAIETQIASVVEGEEPAGAGLEVISGSNDLRERLVSIAPRERSGARSANRFEYQRHWALVELLARHERGDDYCVLFEHHDDVVFLDNVDAPTHLEFFQVKTSDRDWTLTALLARTTRTAASSRSSRGALERAADDAPHSIAEDAAAGLSIVGKLYDNWLKFPEHTRALTFVSNRSVGTRCRLGPGADRERFCAMELHDDEWQRVVEAMRAEHGAEIATDGRRLLHVRRTHIPLGEGRATEQSLGALNTFLDRVAPGHRVPVSALHRAIMSELARRSTYEAVGIPYDDLIAHQGLSRKQFDGMLWRAGIAGDPTSAWQDVRAQLVQESWPFLRLRDLHHAWLAYEVDRMDGTNAPLQRQRRRVRTALSHRSDASSSLSQAQSLADVVAAVRASCRSGDAAIPAPGQTDVYVTAMILLELATDDPADDHTVQTTHSRPPQEAA